MNRIKKFKDINESRVDKAEELSVFLSGKLRKFLTSLRKLAKNYVENISFDIKKETKNSYRIYTKIPLDREFKTYVHNVLSDNMEDYDYLVEVGEDNPGAQHIYLTFEIDDQLYKIPLILTVSGGDMIYRNDLEYGFWLNTYVAQKV